MFIAYLTTCQTISEFNTINLFKTIDREKFPDLFEDDDTAKVKLVKLTKTTHLFPLYSIEISVILKVLGTKHSSFMSYAIS